MALYTVSSSGQLKITDTGVGSPLSVFHGSTTTIASAPLAGGFNTIYTYNGNYNRISSRGNLKLYSGSYELRGLVAGSTLGESAIGGDIVATQQTISTYAFVDPGSSLTSNGNLILTGTSVGIKAYQIESAVDLSLTSTVAQQSLRTANSTGQLTTSGDKVAPSLRQFDSNGQLTLTSVIATQTILEQDSSGQLVVNRTFSEGVNRNSTGQLTITGITGTPRITLQPTSAGLLKLTTEWYTVNRQGGLSTETIASTAIAAGTDPVQNILNTTRIAFYGITGLTSSGNLTITSFGTPDSDLTQDGALAGSALAANSITERRVNPDQTQFRQLQNVDSVGQLIFTNAITYRIEPEPAQLILSGAAGSNNDRTSSGSLATIGSHTNSSLRLKLSSGQITLAPTGENPLALTSGIAGSALASLPLAGGVDLITGVTKFSSLRTETASGNLTLSGVVGVGLKRLSSGQIVLSSEVVTSSLRTEASSGQMVLSGNGTTSSLRTGNSSGQLVLANANAFKIIQEEESRGYLVTTGSKEYSFLQNNLSSGQTTLTGVVTTSVIFDTKSNARVVLVTAGQNPLTVDNSSLAASPLASISIAGGVDLPGYNTLFESLRNELTQGELILTGQSTNNYTRYESSSGNLVITGTTFAANIRPFSFTSSGQIKLTGTHTKVFAVSVSSNGSVVINGSTEITTIINKVDSSGILTISGNTIASVRTSLTEETSSGNAIVSGTTSFRFIPKPARRENSGGGGYVYASSWDILKPYFPDDRHILGYRDLKTSGIGVANVTGSSTVTFIQGPKVTVSSRKSLSDYIKDVEATPKSIVTVAKSKKVKETALLPQGLKQALLEDEMLLNGTLIYFDSPEDELDRELTL